ncbi:MAG: cellulase family glycosylhydrolase [Oscillospiraceae bacterium]|nr:cellulase family glycosylhydrolase [Oscillospiraceae bacterium]
MIILQFEPSRRIRSRFSEFLDLCDQYHVKLIVGLITGWMSGGLFIPSALYNKNMITDPVALYFQQLFIKGFVGRFKDRKSIYAWDLGNECTNLARTEDRFAAVSWAAAIANAIRAADPSRPVVSGMHNLKLEGVWLIQDQAEFTDILTTHPYPFWCRHTTVDATLSYRTTMHAAAETKWYADIGGKPCLAEEIGTMGPMVCSDEKAADFFRLNLFSLWANGSPGVLWWCNNDQNMLRTFPYTLQMAERELGLIDSNHEPKPVLCEMQKFADFLACHPIDLPKAKEHGVCLLTAGQDQWGTAYMTYALAKAVGLNLKFCYAAEQELPESDLYLVPSVEGQSPFSKDTYEQIKQKVYAGADVYLSAGKVFLEGFEAFVGVKVIDSYAYGENSTVNLDGKKLPFCRPFTRKCVATTAEVLAFDESGNPCVTVNRYGKGRVYFVDAPIEMNLTGMHDGFGGAYERLYQTVFEDHIRALPVRLEAEGVVFTLHEDENGTYLVAINHSDTEKLLNIDWKGNYEIAEVLYGDAEKIRPFDACVFKLHMQSR